MPTGAETGPQQVRQKFEQVLGQQRQIESHNAIEKIVETSETPKYFFAISEPITGPTLHEMIEQDGTRSLELSLKPWAEVSSALDYIAANDRLSHGGVTADSIRFDPSADCFILCNFMFTRLSGAYLSAYSAPEVAAGGAPTPQSDLYSLGAIMYACRAGRPPFAGETASALAASIRNGSIPELAGDPVYLRNVIHKLTFYAPINRYRVAVDAMDDLRNRRSPADIGELQAMPRPIVLPPIGEADELLEVVLPGEESMPDPYGDSARKKNNGLLQSLMSLPAAICGSLLSFVLSPFQPRVAPDASATYRRPRVKSKLELAVLAGLRRAWWLLTRTAFVVVPLSAIHAGYLAWNQQIATVTAVAGKAYLLVGKERRGLQVGQKIDTSQTPIIGTGSDGQVTIAVTLGLVHLEPDSLFQVRRMDIDSGNRNFVAELKVGQAAAEATGLCTQNSRFEITCYGVRTRVTAARYRLTTLDQHAGANVQVRDGSVAVLAGDSRRSISSGVQVWASEIGIDRQALIPDRSLDAIRDQTGGAIEAHPWDRPVNRYRSFEELKLVPAANRLMELLHLKPVSRTPLQNVKALSSARIALLGLSTALIADGDPPRHLDLQTLSETGIDEEGAKPILEPFELHRLSAYYRLDGEKFIVFGRASDANHSLLELASGKVTVLKEEDEARALSEAKALSRATD